MSVSIGKWTKYKLMSKEKKLSEFLPKTQFFSEESLWTMLEQFGCIMIKPCFGYRGKGIIQLSVLEEDRIEVHYEFKKLTFNGKSETYEYLMKHFLSKKGRYIVQKRIPLATIDNCPFDIRVMVQRKRKSLEWRVTGKLAKVAAKGFFITNAARKVLSVKEAIDKSTVNEFDSINILEKLDQAAMLTAQHLGSYYKTTRVFGLDMGIDEKGDIWIIEANLTPSLSMFKLLNDGSYETIKSYKTG
ncbi:YheC/YheD family protein [Neobacillus niacini]|uniref:YheC/YheD family protein n=1 Tax=Neobacillus niacini TaxID=86668 RepID=UPI0039835A26